MSSTNINIASNNKTGDDEASKLDKEFSKAGVELWKIVPVHILSELKIKTQLSQDLWSQKIPFLPLEWFNDRPFADFKAKFEQNEKLTQVVDEENLVKGVAFLTKWSLNVLEQHLNRSTPSVISLDTVNLSITTGYSNTTTTSISSGHKSNLFTWTHVAVLSVDSEKQLVEVEDDVTGEIFWVSPIYVKLDTESVSDFVANIKEAIEKREEAEVLTKYQLMLENIPFRQLDKSKFSKKMINKIKQNLGGNIVLPKEKLLDIIRHYELVHTELDLWKNVEHYKRTLPLMVLPTHPPKNLEWKPTKVHIEHDFHSKRARFNQLQIYTFPQIYDLMQFIRNSCDKLSFTPLFYIADVCPIELNYFDQKSEEHIKEVTKYLYETPEPMIKVIRRKLSALRKTWFDMKVNSWETYLISKLYRLLQLIRYHIQHSIRSLVETSVNDYCNWFCKACNSTLHVPDGFQWGENLIDSPFHETDPIFHVTLKMTGTGTYYTTVPQLFEPTIMKHFEQILLNTHFIEIIDPSILENLIFPDGLYYTSIGLIDPFIETWRLSLIKSIRQNMIPLQAYARRYNDFVGFFALDNTQYVESYKNENHTMLEIKEEILHNMEMRKKLEETVPNSIVIGMIFVLVEPIKKFLIKKRTDMISKLLFMLNEKITEKTMAIVELYRSMYFRLTEPAKTVEELFETQEWLDELPELVKENENKMKLVLFDYDILDVFLYNLSDSDMNLKWEALKWPNIILKRINVTREAQTQDVERFQKNQVSDLALFDSMVEGLNVQVAAYNLEYDYKKATALAKKAEIIEKELNSTIESAESLNNRQKLFKLPELEQIEVLQETINSFKPYQKLWLNGAKLNQELNDYLETPLKILDLSQFSQTLESYKTLFTDLIPQFNELPKVQEVPKAFLTQISNYEENIKIVHLLKHHCWKEEQVLALKNRTDIEIEYSKELTLNDYLDANINQHFETVEAILNDAIEDFNRLEQLKREQEEKERKEREYLEMRKRRRDARTDI